MKRYTLENILAIIKGDYKIQGSSVNKFITNVKKVFDADELSLVWIDPTRVDKEDILKTTKAGIIIGDYSLTLSDDADSQKVLIQVSNPKLIFISIVTALFLEKPVFGIHPSAVIHKEAKIESGVFVGPLSYIGKVEIKEGTIIHGNVHIYDDVKIGKNVIIQAGCIIGVSGLSLAKDEMGKFHNFPHLGGVVIEDDVEIQALSVIDRGVLEDTIIGKGTKINSCCYIGHNCKVGRNNVITGHAMLSGSVKTGDNCWISPTAVIRDQLNIGSNSFIGIGSVVVSSLNEESRVMGNPARPIEEVKRILKKLKQL